VLCAEISVVAGLFGRRKASRDPSPGLLVDMKPFSEVVIVWRHEPKLRKAGSDRRDNSQEGSGGVQPLVNKLLTES